MQNLKEKWHIAGMEYPQSAIILIAFNIFMRMRYAELVR